MTERGGRHWLMVRRITSGTCWAYGVWILLTWTASAENLAVGFGIALAVGIAMAPLGEIVPPWRLLDPRRMWGIIRLVVAVSVRIVRKNIMLAGRIWSPSRPLSSGMFIAYTDARTDGELATVALATSLIVDNQIIDLDRTRHLLQFHGIALPAAGRQNARRAVNAPVEAPLRSISRR